MWSTVNYVGVHGSFRMYLEEHDSNLEYMDVLLTESLVYELVLVVYL